MNINGTKILNDILCCSNIKLPMYNSHYMTGKNIVLFSKMACIENTLTSVTSSIKCFCNNLGCLKR